MILQALKEYYDRKPDLPRLGFERKEVPYVVVLNIDGAPVGLEETSEGEGRDRRAKSFLVPQSVKRSVGIAANLLWDTPVYVFGVDLKGNPARAKAQHLAFKNRIAALGSDSDEGLLAVKRFLDIPDKPSVMSAFDSVWKRLIDEGANVTFRLAGDSVIVIERPAIRRAIDMMTVSDAPCTICLVSGEQLPTERLHTAIKGVRDAQSCGANIVSFNLDAFKSYGKEQGANASVGKPVAFAYTTALNHLLRKDSLQKMLVGDATTLFWAERDVFFETQFADFFGESPKDDPDRNARAVKSLFEAPRSGALEVEGETQFYVLGLAPNASRIAVRFWIVDTVAGMSDKIRQHFDDISIVHGPNDRNALSLFRLLVSTATQGKAENISPNMAGDTMRAILAGLPYPATLLQAAIRRLRAEHDITHSRAALIKACINRATRFANNTAKEELKVSLDPSNMNIGYRLGRLFATLEKIQQEANPGINATIRDRFYGAASSIPVTVFGNLMRLKNHHLSKLENVGRRVNFERLLGEIVSGIVDFPSHLILEDQGRFAIGYYHQTQKFFEKKSENTNEKE